MAHGVSEVLGEGSTVKMVHQSSKQQQQQQQPVHQQQNVRKSVGVMGSRRIFAPAFKLKVLDSYRNDIDCRGNQRATARKYGIHRRQIQKWLQCEDNLRSSCAETGNNNASVVSTVTTNTAVLSVASKTEESSTSETTGPSSMTPATAPALNLSLGRQHGDELPARQGPPPSHPCPSGSGSPSSPQYVPQGTILPLYPGYAASQEQQHCFRREFEDGGVRVPEVPCYGETPERNYYVLGGEERRELESSPYAGRNETKVYQPLGSGYDHRFGGGVEMVGTAVNGSPSGRQHHQQESQGGDVVSAVDGKTYGLLLAPSMIKTERASPDSAATPGTYESARSPDTSRAPFSHRPVADTANGISTSVHFESPRSSTSPGSHVLVHEHVHACTTADSEKPIPRPLERESREEVAAAAVTEERSTETAREELDEKEEEIERAAIVKEEIRPYDERDADNEEGIQLGVVLSSCTEYQRPAPASSLPFDEATSPASPVLNDRETVGSGYSLPSSPRGANSSGRSTSSCSDSEMDALDCSPGSQNSPGDLTRRRSFSLRFKLDVLDAFHRDAAVAGNQRATARKFGINRRQVQKWLGQETELRGEIALRGNSRQRLGPVQDSTSASGELPVDLRTTTTTTTTHYPVPSQDRIDVEYERSPRSLYCCDIGSSSSSTSSQLAYYHRHPADLSPEMEARTCTMACCVDSPTNASTVSTCYQELPTRGSFGYAESQVGSYCYSPRESHHDAMSLHELQTERTSTLKRTRCTLACCYDIAPSPKRLCLEVEEPQRSITSQDTPPQETPLCLVKPKRPYELSPSRFEPVTSTVPTPPESAAPAPTVQTLKKDAILFKPYLDNPVSKPTNPDHANRGSSPNAGHGVVNNNNCHSICNLNEDRGNDFALELSLRVPISWRTHQSTYSEFPQGRSAFVRYPASPHYT